MVPKTEKQRIVENVPSFILIAKIIQTITGYTIIKVWMSIFHIINLKKKNSWTQESPNF